MPRLRFSCALIGQPPDAADGARAQLFRRRGRLTHRGDGDAQLDELRRGERNLRDGMAIPLLRNQPLVEADAQPGGRHVVGGEAVSCGEAGLRVLPQRGQQAILIGVVVGRGGVNGSRPSASMGKASAAANGFAQKQQSTDFPAARGDEFRKNAGLRTGRLLRNGREKIRRACRAPDAEVFFLVGGTQTNATVLDAVLQSYQGLVDLDGGSGSAVRRAVTTREGPSRMTALRL